MVSINRQAISELETFIHIALNAKKLSESVKQIVDAHDAFLKDQEDAARIKQADKIVEEANNHLADTNKQAQIIIDDAKKISIQTQEKCANREKILKEGEQSLEKAREEFNKECKVKRNEINVELLTATKAKQAARKEQVEQDELRATLAAEIEKYKGLNEKLSVLNAVAKVA